MARKIIVELPVGVELPDAARPLLLAEVRAVDERQLQEQVKGNPDLLPVEEFDLVPPLLVVGRETRLSSGAVDLVALARGGEILIVEFKTGPDNADFRASLAQLLDYGSDLWEMTYEEFEEAVARRYFKSDNCSDSRFQGDKTLADAAKICWPDRTEEDTATFQRELTRELESGAFHYAPVAQRFVPSIERSLEYLNAVTDGPQFYAVELVRFVTDGVQAFEARTVKKPTRRTGQGVRGDSHIDRRPSRTPERCGISPIRKGLFGSLCWPQLAGRAR